MRTLFDVVSGDGDIRLATNDILLDDYARGNLALRERIARYDIGAAGTGARQAVRQGESQALSAQVDDHRVLGDEIAADPEAYVVAVNKGVEEGTSTSAFASRARSM